MWTGSYSSPSRIFYLTRYWSMGEKGKFFYFTVFVLVVFALVFHLTAMGHHHWKRAEARNATYGNRYFFNSTTIGLFTRCIPAEDTLAVEQCFPNRFPMNYSCNPLNACLAKTPNEACRCDFLPSSKGIASCAIIASVFLGLALIILFIHSIKTSETRSLGLILSLLPFIFLLLAWMFILTTLILVGSYLSRDIMHLVQNSIVTPGPLRTNGWEARWIDRLL